MQQGAVRERPHVYSIDRPHGLECRVPECPRFRGVDRLRANRFCLVVEAIGLPICRDICGPGLPLRTLTWLLWDLAQGPQGPRWPSLGGVLAEALLPGIHRGGNLSQITVLIRVACLFV